MTDENVNIEEMLDVIEGAIDKQDKEIKRLQKYLEGESIEKEINRLRRYEYLVSLIASEPHELSWEKVQSQRDYWKELARKLVKEDFLEVVDDQPELKDDF